MRIIADQNIPYAEEAFGTLGTVQSVPGRSMTADLVRDADLLVVRSITKVNADLLEGSSVRFVGTCTIGEDHVDKEYLALRNIAFSSAPGCNANSVGEYIVAALLELAQLHRLDLPSLKLGIVGVGNVGTKVYAKAQALGMTCVLNDPPLFEKTGDPKYRPIEEILGCDIITFHVPMQKAGPYATYHLADETFIRSMKRDAILINSARGSVVLGSALHGAIERKHLRGAVLDVWEGEPNVDMDLLDAVDIGTPHIAGYSFDGKVNGTVQVYQAACRHLGVTPEWEPAALLPDPEVPELTVYSDEPNPIGYAVHEVYDIIRDDAGMREMLGQPESERGQFFDGLRKNYPRRREFQNTRVSVSPPDEKLEAQLAGLGFRTHKSV